MILTSAKELVDKLTVDRIGQCFNLRFDLLNTNDNRRDKLFDLLLVVCGIDSGHSV